VFRDGNSVELQSKSGLPLARYFPDVVESVLRLKASRFVCDSEIVIPVDGRLSFEALQLRLHPAASRVAMLAAKSPASLVVFDLLVDSRGKSLLKAPLHRRRSALQGFFEAHLGEEQSLRLCPATRSVALASEWLSKAGGNFDGVIAKRLDMEYRSGDRSAMQKIKRLRTADCVVGGFRFGAKTDYVGSLLLGLYGEDGLLHNVGFTSALGVKERKSLTPRLRSLIQPPGFTGRSPGGPSRWNPERSGAWEPLRPELVVEVQYDHFTGGRFRHGARLLRWRPDKSPRQCTMAQVEQEAGLLDLPR
jgi:ATP-dependent DNA ligase